MTQTHTSRAFAASVVIAALLCPLPAVGHVGATGSCDRPRDGQQFIDWARARSNRNHPPDPDRQPQPLRALLDVIDGPPEGQSFIDWARAQSTQDGAARSARLSRRP